MVHRDLVCMTIRCLVRDHPAQKVKGKKTGHYDAIKTYIRMSR